MSQNHCLGQADVELLCTGQRHVQGSSQGDQVIQQLEEHLIWLVWQKEMSAVSHQNDEETQRGSTRYQMSYSCQSTEFCPFSQS